MPDARSVVLIALTALISYGTAYSMIYNTYLDTSDPLVSHLPHPLRATSYFASKSNLLNVIFIKRAWGWTAAVFTFSFFAGPPSAKTWDRVVKFFIYSSTWVLFTTWFFGPALFDRIILASGSECVISLPTGGTIGVPTEACHSRVPLATSELSQFSTLDFTSHPDWKAIPRLRRGHDVSGHIFLLTLSSLFLADQLRPYLKAQRRSILHKLSLAIHSMLIVIWLVSTYTTSVYFHSPAEKISGYLLGLVCYSITQLPILNTAYERPVTRN